MFVVINLNLQPFLKPCWVEMSVLIREGFSSVPIFSCVNISSTSIGGLILQPGGLWLTAAQPREPFTCQKTMPHTPATNLIRCSHLWPEHTQRCPCLSQTAARSGRKQPNLWQHQSHQLSLLRAAGFTATLEIRLVVCTHSIVLSILFSAGCHVNVFPRSHTQSGVTSAARIAVGRFGTSFMPATAPMTAWPEGTVVPTTRPCAEVWNLKYYVQWSACEGLLTCGSSGHVSYLDPQKTVHWFTMLKGVWSQKKSEKLSNVK